MDLVITIVNSTVSVLIFAVFIYVILGYFLAPTHPLRRFLGQVIEPMLKPIRKIIPSLGGFDLSPLILLILLQVLGAIVVRILRSFS
jgi:YggT family protein